jgi:hypothetical protein
MTDGFAPKLPPATGPARYPARANEEDAAARHDHEDVRMVGEGRAPRMEHRGDADADSEFSGRPRSYPASRPPP